LEPRLLPRAFSISIYDVLWPFCGHEPRSGFIPQNHPLLSWPGLCTTESGLSILVIDLPACLLPVVVVVVGVGVGVGVAAACNSYNEFGHTSV